MTGINAYFKDTGVGTGSDRLKIEEDGTINRTGNATTWDDLVGSLIGRSLSATSGKVDYDWEENAINFQPGGSIATEADRLVWNFQFPHSAKVDSTLGLHMHYEQPDATDREFTLKYRIQSNNAAKTTSWTTVVVSTNTNNVFSYVSGTLNQICALSDIDMTGAGISATIQFQLARTDSETGDVLVTFVDAHVESDTSGSRTEYSK